jgi:hypothetical protein
MRFRKKYTDINDTLRYIKVQIIDGIKYAEKTSPVFNTPRQLWDYLKPKLHYKNDPPGIELLQSYETLICNNWHGKPGFGDCDCFTIATVTLAIASRMHGVRIVLAGRDKESPVHIWTEIKHGGKIYTLDFTENDFNTERKYKYTQIIPVKWTNWNF